MPGYNHPADCPCGWCVKESSTGWAKPAPSVPFFPRQFSTYESFVDPNARCPVCGESVFFYQSPYGGRVFFDDLGPPWPRHPCTSSEPLAKQSRPQSRLSHRAVPQWQGSGWEPLKIVRTYKEDDWWVVRADVLGPKERPIRLLFFLRPPLENKMVALFKGWDDQGFGEVSYLDENGESQGLWAYSYAEFALEKPEVAIGLRTRAKPPA